MWATRLHSIFGGGRGQAGGESAAEGDVEAVEREDAVVGKAADGGDDLGAGRCGGKLTGDVVDCVAAGLAGKIGDRGIEGCCRHRRTHRAPTVAAHVAQAAWGGVGLAEVVEKH